MNIPLTRQPPHLVWWLREFTEDDKQSLRARAAIYVCSLETAMEVP